LRFTSSAAADTLVWTQTQANGDNDMVFKFVEDDGTGHTWRFDDGPTWFRCSDVVEAPSLFAGAGPSTQIYPATIRTNAGQLSIDPALSSAAWLYLCGDGDADSLRSYAAYNNFKFDTYFGQVGVADTLISNCSYNAFNGSMSADALQLDAVYGLIRSITADYVATASDWQILVEDTARVTLPALSIAFDSVSAATGYGLQIDVWASTDACTISTVADSIWGNVEVILTPGDNASFRACKDWWIIR